NSVCFLDRCIYNNITYLYHQYNISVVVIFCHTNFAYYSDVCCFVKGYKRDMYHLDNDNIKKILLIRKSNRILTSLKFIMVQVNDIVGQNIDESLPEDKGQIFSNIGIIDVKSLSYLKVYTFFTERQFIFMNLQIHQHLYLYIFTKEKNIWSNYNKIASQNTIIIIFSKH
ncbi:hypothetical protein ACJX0J_013263, partial [Zea mays]